MGKCVSKHEDGDDEDESSHFNLAGGNVHLVATREEWDKKLSEGTQEGKIVLANFSATWCGPCKQMAPYYSELSNEYPSFIFLVVDVDQMSDLSTTYEIKATPSIFFIKDGQEIDKLIGANKTELLSKLTAIEDSQPQPQPQ